MKVAAVILAAGSSTRFGSDKLCARIHGVPIWKLAFQAFASHPAVDLVGVVTTDYLQPSIAAEAPQAAFVVLGGDSRQASARAGLSALPNDVDIVLFHDAARPFVSSEVISRVIAGVHERGASFPALPVVDTIKQRVGKGLSTLDRNSLMAVQTPQGARKELFERAHRLAESEATDDMALIERLGIVPLAVEGEPANIKITRPEDLPAPCGDERMDEIRTGLGYDVHRFSPEPERELWLGGVLFDERPGLEGHSDADALIHALVNAILGAAALGDIGEHFPVGDPRWHNARSGVFLNHAADLVKTAGWSIINLDASVIAERPKLLPRREEMRASIARSVGIDVSRVSIKATTNERLGAIGRSEGVAAFAVATLAR